MLMCPLSYGKIKAATINLPGLLILLMTAIPLYMTSKQQVQKSCKGKRFLLTQLHLTHNQALPSFGSRLLGNAKQANLTQKQSWPQQELPLTNFELLCIQCCLLPLEAVPRGCLGVLQHSHSKPISNCPAALEKEMRAVHMESIQSASLFPHLVMLLQPYSKMDYSLFSSKFYTQQPITTT